MSNKRLNGRDRYFIRKDGNGIAISGSGQWRKRIPRGQGNWVDITECVVNCCNTSGSEGSYVLLRLNNVTDTEVTNITFPGYSWSGTLANGDFLVVPLPYGFNEDLTVTVDVPTAALAISSSTIAGAGTVSVDPTYLSTDTDPQTFVVTVSSTPGSQYLVTLTDD